MNVPSRNHSPEILESRIAPASFYLSGTSLAVVAEGGADANDATAATAAGADLAIGLTKGDTLVLDANGNAQLDLGETAYATVTGGNAIAFVTDLDSNAAVGPAEITGFAVGEGFNAVVAGDINGPVVTSLGAALAFDPATLFESSIVGLTVSGRVTDQILAGKNIAGISIGGEMPSATPSAAAILSGTAANGESISFDGGATSSNVGFAFAVPGTAGGSISKIQLAGGTPVLAASDGADNAVKNGGKGGDVKDVRYYNIALADGESVEIRSGNGGEATGVKGVGGAGGNLSAVTATSDTLLANHFEVGAGHGGDGDGGGLGGSISKTTIRFTSVSASTAEFIAGNGGSSLTGGETGNGGNGGSISDSKVTVVGVAGWASATFGAGDGGDAGGLGKGKGGNGGNLSKVSALSSAGDSGAILSAGNGGTGVDKGSGGNGGNASGITLTVGSVNGSLFIGAGFGGDTDLGKAGNGGAVLKPRIDAGSVSGDVEAVGGNGGSASDASGGGGVGGKIDGLTSNTGAVAGDLAFLAGSGGAGNKGGIGGNISATTITSAAIGGSGTIRAGSGGFGQISAGGNGGAISKLAATLSGDVAGGLTVESGRGGDGAGDAKGGGAGNLSGVKLTKNGGTTGDYFVVGAGGGNGSGLGTGGNGGSLKGIEAYLNAPLGRLRIGNQNGGGDAGFDALKAGLGGSAGGVKVFAGTGVVLSDAVEVFGGSGGNSFAPGAVGGAGGSVSGVTAEITGSMLRVNTGAGLGYLGGGDGGTGVKSLGGKGGLVKSIVGKVGNAQILGQGGGAAEGTGGDGGSISGVKFETVTSFIQLVAAGPGGDGGSVGGKGGSIGGLTLPTNADLGNFAVAFGIDPLNPAMGGLVAGVSGSVAGLIDPARNGSVSGVTAGRIAAILAGDAYLPTPGDGIQVEHVVNKISKIVATAIGADVNGDTTFDWTDGGGSALFALGDGDTPIDGLVIARTGTAFPVAPLKLIEV
jgi:hypothetical protein